MSKDRSIESLREMLNDPEQMLAFIDSGPEQIREHKAHYDPSSDRFYKYTARIARSNAERVFQYSESPIETMFLNCLVVGFMLADPTNLHVLPPPHDAVEAVKDKREYLENCQQWYWMFQQLTYTDRIDGFKLFLKDRVREGSFTDEAAEDMYGVVLLMQATHLQRAFHLIMQAPFPNLKIDGRSVRADAYLWIPSDPSFSLIVECDGHEFHSDQGAFERDRKRDRAFAAAGYRVLRFSGGEIYADPIGKSRELFDFLEKHSQLHAAPDEIPIPQVLKDALRANVDDFRSHYPVERYQHPERAEDDTKLTYRKERLTPLSLSVVQGRDRRRLKLSASAWRKRLSSGRCYSALSDTNFGLPGSSAPLAHRLALMRVGFRLASEPRLRRDSTAILGEIFLRRMLNW